MLIPSRSASDTKPHKVQFFRRERHGVPKNCSLSVFTEQGGQGCLCCGDLGCGAERGTQSQRAPKEGEPGGRIGFAPLESLVAHDVGLKQRIGAPDTCWQSPAEPGRRGLAVMTQQVGDHAGPKERPRLKPRILGGYPESVSCPTGVAGEWGSVEQHPRVGDLSCQKSGQGLVILREPGNTLDGSIDAPLLPPMSLDQDLGA